MSTSKIPDLLAQPLVDIDFDDIEGEALRNKARFLREMFPGLRIIFIYYTLMTFKADLDNSVACLTNEPPIKFFADMTELGKYFPESKMEQIRDVLVAEMGDFDAAKKRLERELALDEVTSQISIPPQDDQPSKDTTKACSSPSTLTSTTTTSHINGIVKSFKISTNTQTKSVVKSKPSAKPAIIDLTNKCHKSSAYSSLEQCSSPPLIKNEDNSSGGGRTQDTVKFDASAVNNQTLFLGKSLTDCESALQTCHGDKSAAYNLLDKEYIANLSSPNNTSAARMEGSNGASSQGSRDLNIITNAFAEKFPTDRVTGVENEGGDPRYNGISQDKIELLSEFLGGKVSPYECKIALHNHDGDENRVFNLLSMKYNIMEDPDENEDVVEARSGNPLRRRGEESIIAGLHECRERVLQSTASGGSHPDDGKRRRESPDTRAFKKARLSETEHAWASDPVEDEMDEDEDEDEFVEAYLAPAGKWLRNTYPNSSGIILKFDNDLTLRDNVPKEVLCTNFDFLKHAIEAATKQESGPSETKISIPFVHADNFDLAMQFFICGNITLGENTPNEERISAILATIDTAMKLEAPLFATLISKMVSKLEAILRRDYLALRNSHIRRAYEMGEHVADIHKIFLYVAIKRQMQYTEDDSNSPFHDDDEDDMTAAQHASYSGSDFVFNREKKRNPQFELALMSGVLRCLAGREKIIKRVRRGNVTEISVPLFTDPLTKKQFEL